MYLCLNNQLIITFSYTIVSETPKSILEHSLQFIFHFKMYIVTVFMIIIYFNNQFILIFYYFLFLFFTSYIKFTLNFTLNFVNTAIYLYLFMFLRIIWELLFIGMKMIKTINIKIININIKIWNIIQTTNSFDNYY